MKPDDLTTREWEVAVLVSRGHRNSVIADRLGVSLGTVASHVEHIREKLAVHSRSEIATWVANRQVDGSRR